MFLKVDLETMTNTNTAAPAFGGGRQLKGSQATHKHTHTQKSGHFRVEYLVSALSIIGLIQSNLFIGLNCR